MTDKRNPNTQFRPEPNPIDTIGIEPTVTCSLSVEVSPMCPIYDEIDRYEVVIEWVTEDKTLEKHRLKEFIQSFGGSEVTQEALCEQLYDEISEEIDATVTVRDIAHMDMEVTKG